MRGGNADTKGSTMSEADVQALISSFDDNGDGKLSIEEVSRRRPCLRLPVSRSPPYWILNL